MKQTSLVTVRGFEVKSKAVRRRVALAEMEQIVLWAELVALIAPHAPTRGSKGRPPAFRIGSDAPRIHFLRQWFTSPDQAIEDAMRDVLSLYLGFAGIDISAEHLPDESTIPRLRHPLEEHGLNQKIFDTVAQLLAARGLPFKASCEESRGCFVTS